MFILFTNIFYTVTVLSHAVLANILFSKVFDFEFILDACTPFQDSLYANPFKISNCKIISGSLSKICTISGIIPSMISTAL